MKLAISQLLALAVEEVSPYVAREASPTSASDRAPRTCPSVITRLPDSTVYIYFYKLLKLMQ